MNPPSHWDGCSFFLVEESFLPGRPLDQPSGGSMLELSRLSAFSWLHAQCIPHGSISNCWCDFAGNETWHEPDSSLSFWASQNGSLLIP